jgi:DNA primase large subunit
MDKGEKATYFPFLDSSKEYVSNKCDFSDMMNEKKIEKSIKHIQNSVDKNNSISENREKELYPLSRLIVSYIDDYRIMQKYCQAEARSSISKLKELDHNQIENIVNEMGLNVTIKTGLDYIENTFMVKNFENMSEEKRNYLIDDFENLLREYLGTESEEFKEYSLDFSKSKFFEILVHENIEGKNPENICYIEMSFDNYVRIASCSPIESSRLMYNNVEQGSTIISLPRFFEPLESYIKSIMMEDLPYNLDDTIQQKFEEENVETKIRENISEDSFSFEIDEVDSDLFPPIIQNLLSRVKSNERVNHNGRFTLGSFLVNIGMTNDEIVDILDVNDSFGEEPTRYQLRDIRDGRSSDNEPYAPPSYSKIKSWGIEWDEDSLEEKVAHPLNYYKLKLKQKNQGDNNNYDDDS